MQMASDTVDISLDDRHQSHEFDEKMMGLEWSDITLSRKDFQKLRNRLDSPSTQHAPNVSPSSKTSWVFPVILLSFCAFMLSHKLLGAPSWLVIVSKWLMFVSCFYFIATDENLKKMGLSYALQMILAIGIGFVFIAAISF